ncbi:MAG: hypothetical protein DYG94_09765 [Leptolyngbya sp. PLA3]|nr:MAG: hypothetical protein EDM82_07930 [Cyanobacteria bacterium CYA]MCE7969016.1 hypothetical protein [Leptolyngbya sp. PL-A3]
MENVIQQLLDNEDTLLMLLIAGTVVICSLFSAVTKIATGMARERTRREIAAYIAEGSMSPEQGERILNSRQRA